GACESGAFDGETTEAEPLTGLQGEGGDSGDQGRADDRTDCGAVRRPPEPGDDLEGTTRRRRGGRIRQRLGASVARRRREGAARQDRRADLGERFFRGRAHQGGMVERKTMIDRDHALSVTKQAAAVGIARSTVYYLPRPV